MWLATHGNQILLGISELRISIFQFCVPKAWTQSKMLKALGILPGKRAEENTVSSTSIGSILLSDWQLLFSSRSTERSPEWAQLWGPLRAPRGSPYVTVLTEQRLVFGFGSKVVGSSINTLGMIRKIILGDTMAFAYLSVQVFLDYRLWRMRQHCETDGTAVFRCEQL